MDIERIVLLLKNSGLNVKGADSEFLYFEDPSCILPAFDTLLDYAWIVIAVLTAIMLFGWALLYIKNGMNINNVFNNAKTIILIFCILSVVKPIVNVVYREDLFAQGCEIKTVSLSNVQELLDMRKKTLSDDDSLYEIFDMVDSGVVYDSVSVSPEDEE